MGKRGMKEVQQEPPLKTRRTEPTAIAHEPSSGWDVRADSLTALFYAVPHEVVPQILRPGVAAFFPWVELKIHTLHDAQCCVATLRKYSKIKDDDIEYAMTLPHLTSVNLLGALLSTNTAELDEIAQLKKLLHLNLNSCSGVTAAGLARVSTISSLEKLELGCCNDLGADSLGHVAKMTRLRVLNLNSCSGVNAKTLALLAKSLPELWHLSVRDCSDIDVDAVVQIGTFPALASLSMSPWSYKHAYSSEPKKELAHLKMAQLSTLALRECSNLCDDDVGLLVENLPQLTALDLRDCEKLTPSVATHLRAMPHLREVNLTECFKIDDETVRAFPETLRLIY